MFSDFLAFVYRLIKGSDLDLHPDLTASSVLVYFSKKGMFPLLRGISTSLTNKNVANPFFRGSGVKFYNIAKFTAEPGCFIGHSSHIDCISLHGLHLGERVTIREFAWIQMTSHLRDPGHSIRIGDNTYIGPFAKLGAAGSVEIGRSCQFGPGLTIIAEEHEFASEKSIFEQGVTRVGVEIGDDCWFGAGVTVLDGVKVGKGCVIGANSLVTRDLPDYCVAVGTPAKPVRSRASM
jgi:acetyltransferase-like isoleucine patch superfamily enzyme